jgi:hypothetical protein
MPQRQPADVTASVTPSLSFDPMALRKPAGLFLFSQLGILPAAHVQKGCRRLRGHGASESRRIL